MKFILISVSCLGIFLMFPQMDASSQVTSGNPIIKHIRTADPSAQVWNDGKVWVYTSHDPADAIDYSTMDNYHVFSSSDLINWTDHGKILESADVSWAISQGGFMFAPDAAYKDGTYYLFFPTMAEGWKWRVGVAASDKPEGPFTDVGHFIEGTDEIDPTCFVDDDGEAYLIWGGGANAPKIARLKENMTELAEEPRIIDYGASNFGEGPFMHKRDGIYYFSYTCNTCYPYQGYYSMGDNPYGPFEYKGNLKKSPPGAQDHHSIIEYHGQWYYFYHTGNYGPGASLYRRNVCVDSLYYNEDGTMQEVIGTTTGVGQDTIGMTPGIIIPGRIEAEEFFRQEGIDTLAIGDTTVVITNIQDSDYFDFVLEMLGTETYHLEIKITDAIEDSKIYVLVDEIIQDTLTAEAGSDTIKGDVFLHRGKHTLKLLFGHDASVDNLMNVDWIDLQGALRYYSIAASTTEGGSIKPEGTVYVVEGDSVEYEIEWDLYYKPDSLLIDGLSQTFSDSYLFRNVNGNHIIEARFETCEGTLLNPFHQVNNEEPVNSSEASVTEGDDLKLLVEYEDPGELVWSDPNGRKSNGNELFIRDIWINSSGIYSAFLTNSSGCKNKIAFNVSVEPFVLDVFEAEKWIGKSGVLNEICSDIGGGLNLGFIENGDWSSYEIEIEKAGIYDFIARVDAAASGGSIELSIDGIILATLNVTGSSSDDWQDWYTTNPVEVEFEQGKQELKLSYMGGEGYLFKLNWFDLEFNRASPVSTKTIDLSDSNEQFFCYPHPDGSGFGIDYNLEQPSNVRLEIINMAGIRIRTLLSGMSQDAGPYSLHWDGESDVGESVSEGIYLLVFSANNIRRVQKVLFLK